MAHYVEFLPGSRQGRLDMGVVWLKYMAAEAKNEKDELVQRWRLWGIGQEIFTDFGNKVGAAQAALSEAKDAAKRTEVIDAKVGETFTALVAAMRSLKRRFFHIPPLRVEDFAALALNAPGTPHVISGEPTAQVIVETFLVGRHQLGIRLVYMSGNPNDRANKTYRIYYKIMEQGEAPPTGPDDFGLSFPERRKNFVKDFEFGVSGKIAYFYVRVENGRKIGPAGSITSALIP